MHHHNNWYGHVRLLARYAGMPPAKPQRLWGYLQHGWNVYDGFGARTPIVAGMPRLVWSDTPRRRGWAVGNVGYEVIGAPWAYLLRMEPEPAPAANLTGAAASAPTAEHEREGTLFYPFHAFDKQAVHGDHTELADEIRSRETGPVTICLYWLEFRNTQVRSFYEDRGFRVISHGYRGDRNRPSDGEFLRRQLAELRRHRRVASNRLTTALLYGASVGCEVGIYGDPMIIENDHPVYGGIKRIQELWPEMHQPNVPMATSSAFAHEELGMRHVVSPAELVEICGWSANVSRATR